MRARVLLAAGLAALLAWLNHALFGDLNLNLRDEGYLWYGVRAVLAGDVPLRDFQAYDPGRYYWSAALSPVLGDGLLGVRAASATFQVLGLTAGLLVASRVVRHPAALALLALALLLWMFPRHKLYESSLTMIGTWGVLRLLEAPTARRHVALGVLCGLAACLGRNHGLYLGLSALATTVLLARTCGARALAGRLGALAGGTLVGYAPLLGMMLLVDGFARGFVEATALLLAQGANLPTPYPWPWRVALDAPVLPLRLSQAAIAVAFLLPVLVYPAAVIATLRTRASARAEGTSDARRVLLACLLVGVPYVHHFAVRSDLSHLAQAAHPLWLALVALPVLCGARARLARGVAWGLLLVLTAGMTVGRHPAITERWREVQAELVEHDVGGGETVRIRSTLDRHLTRVEGMIEHFVGEDDVLFIAPTSPTFYPLLGKASPSWWIYFLWPASEELQRAVVAELEEAGVDWAMIVDKSFDADDRFAFRETNPLVWAHLEEAFQRVQHPVVPPNYVLFRRRRP
jgi:hypothetical protein